jgi:hypothetical protein
MFSRFEYLVAPIGVLVLWVCITPQYSSAQGGPAIADSARENSVEVTYADGLLMIDARNSTMAEVLRVVAQKTGARIDVPAGSGLERIFEHAGPGPVQDVLAHLLNGSSFSFVILASPRAPHVLESVRLLPNSAAASAQPGIELANDTAPGDGEPEVYGAGFSLTPEEIEEASREARPATPEVAQEGNGGPGQPLSNTELDRMQKERLRQRQEQMQQGQGQATNH